MEWTQQPQMALRFSTINRDSFQHSSMTRQISAKTLSRACQHVPCTPSSSLAPRARGWMPRCQPHQLFPLNPKQIGFRHSRKPSVWPPPRRSLCRNPINRQHMPIGCGTDYGPRDACGPRAAATAARWRSRTRSAPNEETELIVAVLTFTAAPTERGFGGGGGATVVSHS